MGPDGDVRLLKAEPHRAVGQHVGDRVKKILRRLAAIERLLDLLSRLLDVAEVGDERPRLRADEGEPVGAAVAGEVPDVGEVGDKLHVDPGAGQRRDKTIAARPHAGSSALISCSAVRYPAGPSPATRPAQSSRMTL